MAEDKKMEWRIKMEEGSSEREEQGGMWVVIIISRLVLKVCKFFKEALELGKNDPRKLIHCLKVGIALSAVSLVYYMKPLYDGFGGNAMWAIMTVVVVFEYTVVRICGTSLAGFLGFGVHWVASRAGEQLEPLIVGVSVFLLGCAATFSRFIPTIKARFDYGAMIFILTFSLVSVSGYRIHKLLDMAQNRLATIVVWFSTLVVMKLQQQNVKKKLLGYKCVLSSKATEDSMANFARWEPHHGGFNFRHPWKQHLKIGASMRSCATLIDALIGCINSENKAPNEIKKHIRSVSLKVGVNSACVIRELANTIRNMTNSSKVAMLVAEMNSATHELQHVLKSYPNLVISTPSTNGRDAKTEAPSPSSGELDPKIEVSLLEIIQVITVASLLIEIVTRVEGIVNTVEELSDLAEFQKVEQNIKSNMLQMV
ncbi:hypothetical protein VNO77_44816 [Canavalia gladiata]|uniref:Aluminum-activated malate transporter 10 n=1 Tax=Canavalia gladiata TaxID=3824 RepID=A0AAN9JZ40_CANGL